MNVHLNQKHSTLKNVEYYVQNSTFLFLKQKSNKPQFLFLKLPQHHIITLNINSLAKGSFKKVDLKRYVIVPFYRYCLFESV